MHNFNLMILRAGFTKALENALQFRALANSSFTGEINQKNDKVKLIQMGDIDINDYDGTDITVQELTDAARELIADRDKSFSYQLDTLEFNNVASGMLSESARKAADASNEEVDLFFASLYAQAGITQNTSGSPANMTSLNVEDEFLKMSEQFAEAGISRSIIKVALVPPWVTTKMAIAGIASKTENSQLYAQGFIGTALGWDFVESNNVSKNSSSWDITRMMFVVPNESLGFASAVSTFETTQRELKIGKTLVKGRFIYGGKVTRPDKTGVMYADKTAEA